VLAPLFPWVKRPGRKTNHSSKCSVKFNACSCTSILLMSPQRSERDKCDFPFFFLNSMLLHQSILYITLGGDQVDVAIYVVCTPAS
jgi:hypothetical protein